MIKKKYILLSLVVVIITCLFIVLRLYVFDVLEDKPAETIWKVTFRLKFISTDRKNIITLPVLRGYRAVRIISEKIIRPGLTLRRKVNKTPEGSRVTLTAGKPGIYTVFTEDVVAVQESAGADVHATENRVVIDQLAKYLDEDRNAPVKSDEVIRELKTILTGNEQDADSVEKIYNYVYRKYRVMGSQDPPGQPLIPVYNYKDRMKVNKFITLVRSINFPARRVTGLILRKTDSAVLHTWAEVYFMNEWIPFDPVYGYAFRIPPGYVMYQYGNRMLYNVSNVKVLDARYSINEGKYGFYQYTRKLEKVIDIFNLNRLPVETRKALVHILLLPFGALFTAFCRLIVGVKSYGTFTPTLLAMTVLYADWTSVLLVLLVIGTVSVSGRSIFPEKMSRIPRLSIILSIIALTMVISVSIVDFFSFNINGDVFLLPIIILTSLVDRFYTAADDNGIRPALYMLGWTILIATGCYLIMQVDLLGDFILTFPESHLITITLIFVIENYTGSKLILYTPLKKYSGINLKTVDDEEQLIFPFPRR